MQITRKRFLGATLGGGAALLLNGCGGGGYGGSGAVTPTSSCGATIANNHNHVLPIAVADLDSPTDKVYDISGSAGHAHSVGLTVAQLRQLKSGSAINVTSSPATSDGHTHALSITCQ